MSATRASGLPTDIPLIDIAPLRGWLDLNFRELWQFREFAYFFVRRDTRRSLS